MKVIEPEEHGLGPFSIQYTNDVLGSKIITTITLPEDSWKITGYVPLLRENIIAKVKERIKEK